MHDREVLSEEGVMVINLIMDKFPGNHPGNQRSSAAALLLIGMQKI